MVQFVDPTGSPYAEDAEHGGKTGGIRRRGWRVSDEVVVIGEHRPRFQLPAEISRHREQPAMKNAQARRAPEAMSFQIRAGREEVAAAHAELMRRCMAPRRALFGHVRAVPLVSEHGKYRPK